MTADEEETAVILLVEDNGGDVALVERAFETRDLPGTLETVETADAALDWIAGRGEYADAEAPGLVLLDLNLPATTGLEFLEAMADDPATRQLPVVVVTSSKSADELLEAYARGANACVRKPVDPDTFADHVEAIVEFWLETAELPPEWSVRPD